MRSANSARMYDVMQILIQYIIPTSKNYKIKAAHEILFIIESCTAIDFFIPLFLSAVEVFQLAIIIQFPVSSYYIIIILYRSHAQQIAIIACLQKFSRTKWIDAIKIHGIRYQYYQVYNARDINVECTYWRTIIAYF